MWKLVSLVHFSHAIAPDLRLAGERFIKVFRAIGMTCLSEYYSSSWHRQMEKIFLPSIEMFLKHRT